VSRSSPSWPTGVASGWHAERGFVLSAERGFGLSAGVDPWQYLTLEWLSGLLRVQGIEASTEELRGLPYDVEFSDRLRVRVSAEA
jgi:hypothetical protein